MSFFGFSKKSRSPSREEERGFKTNPISTVKVGEENENEFLVLPPLSPKATSPRSPRDDGLSRAPTSPKKVSP